MKFWVKAKGEAFEEQLLVNADSAEELKRKLQDLLHISIRQMSIVDFQTQVVEKLMTNAADIITVNIRSGPLGESAPGSTLSNGGSGNMTAAEAAFESSLRGADSSLTGAPTSEGGPLVRTSSGNALHHTSSSAGLHTASSTRRLSGGGGTATEMFNNDVQLPIDRICIKRDDLSMLLSPILRGRFHSVVQGCFVRVRGAFSLGTSASGYATVQVVSVSSETQLGLDLVHIVEIRHIDAVSNSPATPDEVRAWTKHMIHAGRPLVTNAFIEGKLGDVEDAMRQARQLLHPPLPETAAAGSSGVVRSGAISGVAATTTTATTNNMSNAPAQESLRAIGAQNESLPVPPPVVLDDQQQQAPLQPTASVVGRLRRRGTIVLQPQYFGLPTSESLGTSPQAGGGQQSSSHATANSSSGTSPVSGTSPTSAFAPTGSARPFPQPQLSQSPQSSGGGAGNSGGEGGAQDSSSGGRQAVKPFIKQRLDSISNAMNITFSEVSSASLNASPKPLTTLVAAIGTGSQHSSTQTSPASASTAATALAQHHRYVVKTNDAFLNGWIVERSTEDGTVHYSLFGTRHSNPKAKRPRPSDFSAFCMSMKGTEPFIPEVDRDATVKGLIVHGVPQLFCGVFVALATAAPDSSNGLSEDSPASSPERSARGNASSFSLGVGSTSGTTTQPGNNNGPTASGYEFVVVSGRDVFSLYNPPWRCQLPVPPWGAPMSLQHAVVRPQLLYSRERLHCFYLVTLQIPGKDIDMGERCFGLAHAWTVDAKLANWTLVTVDNPIATSSGWCDANMAPLFNVTTGVHLPGSPASALDTMTLVWYEPAAPQASTFQHARLAGGTSKAHVRRSPSISRTDDPSKNSPPPTPPPEPLPTPSPPLHTSPARPSASIKPIVRTWVNLDDAYRPGSWTPHEALYPELEGVPGVTLRDPNASSIALAVDEMKLNGSVRSVSLLVHAGLHYLLVVGEDRHRRGSAILLACEVQ